MLFILEVLLADSSLNMVKFIHVSTISFKSYAFAGNYAFKVIVTDGVNTAESSHLPFSVR